MGLPPFSALYAFGDSLVDSGNALKLAETYDYFPFTSLPNGAPSAGRGYFDGRFTDGYNYTDLISNKLVGLPTKPVFPFGYDDPFLGISFGFFSDPKGKNLNFAYGGAQIRQGGEAVPDLDDQTDAFRDAVDGDVSSNALLLFSFGGNDVHDYVPKTGAWASLATVQEEMAKDAAELVEEVRQCIDIGARHVLVTGVPDIGIQPYYNGLTDEAQRRAVATQYCQMLDQMIRDGLDDLRAARPYAQILYVGFDAITDGVFAQLEQIYPASAIYPENQSSIVFFDKVHPTAQLHALAAGQLVDALSGTPAGDAAPMTHPDFALDAAISNGGEIDKLAFSLVAGTTYSFEMLGISSGKLTPNSWDTLADPYLRIIGPIGTVLALDDDGGLGLDARLQFTPTVSGLYTLDMLPVGSLSGAYRLKVDNASAQNDSYRIGHAAVLVVEGPGGGTDRVYSCVSYALAPGSSIETLSTDNAKGSAAIDLTGNDLAQTLIGNAGANLIDGRGGKDVLTGKGGPDIFAFSTALSPANVDRISDFSAAQDSIRLDDAAFVGLPLGALAPGAFVTGPAAADADDRIVYDPVTRKLYYDADGVGGAPQVQFAVLAGSDLTLSAGDFFVV